MNTEMKLIFKAIASKVHHHLMVWLQLCILFVSLGLAFNSNAQTVTYIHTDGLGSPVAKSDASGTLIPNSRTRYEPYGMEVAGTATPTIGFTGHVNDADTGLTYMQQRYYDPVAGRFLSTDPVLTDENTGTSFNRYTYALNNPYTRIDPDGRESGSFHGTKAVQMADPCHGSAECSRNALIAMATVYTGIAAYVAAPAIFGPAASSSEALSASAGGAGATAAGGTASALATKEELKAVEVNYSVIKNPPNVGVGKDFTLRQKQEALALNKAANGGVVKSDLSGKPLVQPQKSQKGVTPDPNEWQFDHKTPKACGGTNCSSNLQILSREENRAKSSN